MCTRELTSCITEIADELNMILWSRQTPIPTRFNSQSRAPTESNLSQAVTLCSAKTVRGYYCDRLRYMNKVAGANGKFREGIRSSTARMFVYHCAPRPEPSAGRRSGS